MSVTSLCTTELQCIPQRIQHYLREIRNLHDNIDNIAFYNCANIYGSDDNKTCMLELSIRYKTLLPSASIKLSTIQDRQRFFLIRAVFKTSLIKLLAY